MKDSIQTLVDKLDPDRFYCKKRDKYIKLIYADPKLHKSLQPPNNYYKPLCMIFSTLMLIRNKTIVERCFNCPYGPHIHNVKEGE